MPVVLEWDNEEKTAFRTELDGQWTWEEFENAVNASHETMGSVEHRVDYIMWFKSRLPPGDALNHFVRAGGRQPPNVYRTVMVNNAGSLLEAIIRSVTKGRGWVGPAIVYTMEEARDLLTSSEG
jgi:hypothetical protein